MKFVQARLSRKTTEGNQELVSWIPQFGTNKIRVEVGSVVELDGYDGTWQIVHVDHEYTQEAKYFIDKRSERKNLPSI